MLCKLSPEGESDKLFSTQCQTLSQVNVEVFCVYGIKPFFLFFALYKFIDFLRLGFSADFALSPFLARLQQ